MAYSSADDLLLGEIPLPSYINTSKVVEDAADEIDSKLGHLFVTPFDVTETGPLSRPARLLLKRISNNLASGRLILAVASPEENRNLHAYGYNLVREAQEALEAIVKGNIVLEGLQPVVGSQEPTTVPLINNLDPESNVEAFYNRLSNPNYQYYPGTRYTNPDRLVE